MYDYSKSVCSSFNIAWNSYKQHDLYETIEVKYYSKSMRKTVIRYTTSDGDVFRMSTVVYPPAIVSTTANVSLGPSTLHVVKPNGTLTSTILVS